MGDEKSPATHRQVCLLHPLTAGNEGIVSIRRSKSMVRLSLRGWWGPALRSAQIISPRGWLNFVRAMKL